MGMLVPKSSLQWNLFYPNPLGPEVVSNPEMYVTLNVKYYGKYLNALEYHTTDT